MSMELSEIKGLGPKRIKQLNSAGINSVEDLVSYLPYKYYCFDKLNEYNYTTTDNLFIKSELLTEPKTAYFSGRSATTAKFKDLLSGKYFTSVWYNQPFIKNALQINSIYYLYGKNNNKHQLTITKYFNNTNGKDILPVYNSINNVGGVTIKNAIDYCLERYNFLSYIPSNLEQQNNLLKLQDAFNILHNPQDISNLELAKSRISLEKLLLFASLEDSINNTKTNKNFKYQAVNYNKLFNDKGITLTQSQKNALNEIYCDMDSNNAMNRLVLGDVGSGKTFIAFGAVFKAINSGYQAVMMCPTEIVAKQHYYNAIKLFGINYNIALLYGKQPVKEQNVIKQKLLNGEINFLIATHSVLNDDVVFNNLSLVITDEQHRFGVLQRGKLSYKNTNPDCLLLSATPIPRTLSLVLFGGLKTSNLTERPFGDSKIKTNILSYNKENDMIKFLSEQVKFNGAKCYIIVSRISSDNNNDSLECINSVYNKFINSGLFTNSEIAIMHSKLLQSQKEDNINNFKNGNAKILISTTVVEVGVDVKDANILVIYNAERFGLATLHQLRGRVGRDGRQGYCFCLNSGETQISKDRLNILKKYNDGLKIAEEDLKLRGAGTFYGTNQHGASELYNIVDFSVDGYNLAKQIYSKLDSSNKQIIINKAKQQFGKLYTDIVLN